MMNDQIHIRLDNVSKTFRIRDKKKQSLPSVIRSLANGTFMRRIEAVKNVSIEVRKGEFFGIVGANGSGKSTILHLMSGVYKPDPGGSAKIFGSYMRLSLGMGFNHELTARENIYVNASIMGLTFREIGKKFHQIISFAELEDFIDTKIKYYSRGMTARLGFAIAIHANPEILLLDEIFGGVGDEKFREKSEQVFKEKLLEGRTIVLVSHNLGTIKDNAERVMLMDKGSCIKIGSPEEVFLYYKEVLKVKELKIESR